MHSIAARKEFYLLFLCGTRALKVCRILYSMFKDVIGLLEKLEKEEKIL